MMVGCEDRQPSAGKRVKALVGIKGAGRLKLDRLESTASLNEICSEWPDRSPGPLNVEIVDYH